MNMKAEDAVSRRAQMRLQQVPEFLLLLKAVLDLETRAAREAFDGTEKTLREWVEAFYPLVNAKLAQDARAVVRTYGEKISGAALEEIGQPNAPFDLDALAASYAVGLADRWTNDSIAQFRAMARDEEGIDLEEQFEKRLLTWEAARAPLAAEREATQAGSAFVKVPFIVAGVEELRWVALGESCPLCTSMHGRVVSISAPFLKAGETLDPGGETNPLVTDQVIGHPPLHGLNGRGGVCDCLIVAN